MSFSYENLYSHMNNKGITFNYLLENKVIPDHSARLIRNGKSVHIEHLANLCIFLDINIEDAIEIIR